MLLPYKIDWRKEWLGIFILIITLATSFYFYQNFPDTVPTHWNIYGQPDNWSGKEFAAFFFPGLIIILYLMMIGLPFFDPMKQRYQEFSKTYQIIRISFILFLSAIYFLASLNALGYKIPIDKVTPLGIGLLFIILGNFLPKVKKNWFVGIRTPWTLSNEDIWNKTHRLGGKIFMFCGLLMIMGIFFDPKIYVFLFGIIIFLTLFFSFGYSWWLWHKNK